MFTKKILLKTFGDKIAPYGFMFSGYKHRRYTFSRMADGTEQTFVVQSDPGDHSFQLEISTDVGRDREIQGEFWDLTYHFYRNSVELENILNLLGDHVVNRVIPRLTELSIPKREVNYTEMLTEEMYSQLEQEKEGLIQNFMMRNEIDAGQGTDLVMGSLLREVEQIKGLSFEETVEQRKELAAVYGDIIMREIGGEWVREDGWQRRIAVKSYGLVNDCREHPLDAIAASCQRSGGASLAARYVRTLWDYRKKLEKSQQEYGSNWMPLQTSGQKDTGLLSKEIVAQTLGNKLAVMGFRFGLSNNGFSLETQEEKNKLRVVVMEESCHRKTFYIMLGRHKGYYLLECMYKKFCYYKDETDLCQQLMDAGEEMLEVIRTGQWTPDPYIPRHCKCCHVTDEMSEEFKEGRTEMAERFRKRNRLEKTSKEEDIIQCIVKELDSIAVGDRNQRELMRYYDEKKEQLLELGAAYGDLLIREMGGNWPADEKWRMRQSRVCLENVPGIDKVDLPQEMIRHWEHFGSEAFLHAHQEYKWAYGKWRSLCQLAGIQI